jgi:hypothetical protein
MFLPWRHRRCLKADLLISRHSAAEPSNRMLVSLSHCVDILLQVLSVLSLSEIPTAFRVGRTIRIESINTKYEGSSPHIATHLKLAASWDSIN